MKLLSFNYRKIANIMNISWIILGLPYFLTRFKINLFDPNITNILLSLSILLLIGSFVLKIYSHLNKHDEIIEKSFYEFHSEILKRLVIISSLSVLPIIFSIFLNIKDVSSNVESISMIFVVGFIFAVVLPIDSILINKLKNNGFNDDEIKKLIE